jgi:hypothetical protein
MAERTSFIAEVKSFAAIPKYGITKMEKRKQQHTAQ